MNTESAKPEDKAALKLMISSEYPSAYRGIVISEADGYLANMAICDVIPVGSDKETRAHAELIVTAVNEYASLKSEVERLKEQKAKLVKLLNKINELSEYDANHDNMLYACKEINDLIKSTLQNSGQ